MTSRLDPSKIQKILVVSLTNLGDIILTTPVIANLRRAFPSTHLAVVIGPKGKDLLSTSSSIDEVIVYDKKAMSLIQKLFWIIQLRQKKFDLVIDLRDTLIPYVIGAKFRTKLWHLSEPVKMRDKHLFRLQKLGILPSDVVHFNFYSEIEKTSALKKMDQFGLKRDRPIIAIAPGAGSYLKRWPVNQFAEVARYFSDKNYSVVVIGSESEKELGDTIKKRAVVLNLCGIFTLRELAAFLTVTNLLMSCDSAIMHLGNELNIPTISIFGPTDFKKYAKTGIVNRVVRKDLSCAPCEKAHCRFPRQACLDDVKVEDVIAVGGELLQ